MDLHDPPCIQMALRCLAAGFSAGLATAGAKSSVEAALFFFLGFDDDLIGIGLGIFVVISW